MTNKLKVPHIPSNQESDKYSNSQALPYTQVALSFPQRRLFDYRCNQRLTAGQRVLVPFAHRVMVGVVINQSAETDCPTDKLKSILKVLDLEPLLSPHLLGLMKWAASYYHHPLGEVIFTTLPSLLRKENSALDSFKDKLWCLSNPECFDDQKMTLKRAKKQLALMTYLFEQPQHKANEIQLKAQGFSSTQWKTLEKKGFLHSTQLSLSFEAFLPETKKTAQDLQVPLTATEEQQVAINTVLKQEETFHCHLLEGVTGSGKTEVYLQTLAPFIEKGKQALILVPEISLTPQTLARFQARFGVCVLSMHSNLSDRERLAAWMTARNGEASIIIGTRSAVFTPFKDLGIIIIDEEHDLSFKQMSGFRYSARDIAITRARLLNIPILLGSATPSLESLKNAYQQRFTHLELKNRAGIQNVAPIELVDIRQHNTESGFSPIVLAEMKKHLNAGNQVLVFLNRRGFAPTLLCDSCQWIAECPSCSVRLTLHHNPAKLHCHHCDYQGPIPSECPSCKSPHIVPLGQGTERNEMKLQHLFPETEIIRVDRDSASGKYGFQELFKRIHSGKPGILVGTQLLAKGHHFPHVTLVVILDADSGLFSADFRGLEKMAQMIVQVSGRAGRAEKPGTGFDANHV